MIILSDLFRKSIDKLVKDSEDENCLYESTKQPHYINEKEIDFLCRAKKSTYADKGGESTSLRTNSHDLQYVENNLKYIDTYLGGKNLLVKRQFGVMIHRFGQ